jgi:hypothetical protein
VLAMDRGYGLEQRLIAFSPRGGVIDDVLVTFTPWEVTGGSGLSWRKDVAGSS